MDRVMDIVQIIFADLILSGDNALVIGMAAAGLAPELRRKAILIGMAMAAGLRIIFAAIASTLIGVPGILFGGGLLLLWVCWRFWGEVREFTPKKAESLATATGAEPEGVTGTADDGVKVKRKTLLSAMITITIADVSMSIDNVLAVAAIARDDTTILIFGLALAIAFMAFCAAIIMRVMTKNPWLSYVGLAFLLYLSLHMMWDGWPHVAKLIGLGGAA